MPGRLFRQHLKYFDMRRWPRMRNRYPSDRDSNESNDISPSSIAERTMCGIECAGPQRCVRPEQVHDLAGDDAEECPSRQSPAVQRFGKNPGCDNHSQSTDDAVSPEDDAESLMTCQRTQRAHDAA